MVVKVARNGDAASGSGYYGLMSASPIPPVECADRPLRRDAERNRQRILQAAGELFAERGLGVTLDDVAHHAGVGVGTVYRRFAAKDDLIYEVYAARIHATEQTSSMRCSNSASMSSSLSAKRR